MQSDSEPQLLSGGQILTASLIRNGVDTIFGLPGVQLDGAFVGLDEAVRRGELTVIHPRHEQTTAYMADGYARVAGRMGVCLVVPGPGLLNATAALSTAYACGQPVLVVSGQLNRDRIDQGRGSLHEIPDQRTMVRSVTKHAELARDPANIPGVLNEAITALWSGYVRPVEIEVPWDTLHERAKVQLLPAAELPAPLEPDPDEIATAADLIASARNPFILTGGGIITADATEELSTLARLLQAPVMPIHNGKGAISDRDPLAQSNLSGQWLLEDADLVIAVGTRVSESNQFPWFPRQDKTYVQIDVDPEQIGRNFPAKAAIVADTKPALRQLIAALESRIGTRPSRSEELIAIKAKADAVLDSIQPQAGYCRAIRRTLPDDGIIVNEMTQMSYWMNLGMPMYQPRTYLTAGYQGTLGWGYPTSLGAKIGAPDQVVISVTGDGGFGYCLNELATQAQHGIASITLVFNDNAFGNVKRMQTELYPGTDIAANLVNPDYVQLANAFGISGRRATTPNDLETELAAAIAANEPTLIEVPVGPMPNPWTIATNARP